MRTITKILNFAKKIFGARKAGGSMNSDDVRPRGPSKKVAKDCGPKTTNDAKIKNEKKDSSLLGKIKKSSSKGEPKGAARN